MKNQKLLETLADIAYIAGNKNYYSGDSRADISTFIFWAKQFENKHKTTCWGEVDYIITVEEFAEEQIKNNPLPIA